MALLLGLVSTAFTLMAYSLKNNAVKLTAHIRISLCRLFSIFKYVFEAIFAGGIYFSL